MTAHTSSGHTRPGPGTPESISLLAEVADELVVSTARDTHLAWLDRVDSWVGSNPIAASHHFIHRSIASTVYSGVGLGLRSTRLGADAVARLRRSRPTDRRLENAPAGRFVRSAVNGLIGDRLEEERPEWALPMSVRRHDADVRLDSAGLAEAYPDATGDVVVFMHGLCENESYWDWQTDKRGPGYPATLAELGWTPVLVRANTGLPLRTNGAALAGVLQGVVAHWPVPVERIALVGHSMGGLIIRAAAAVHGWADVPWSELVTDVVTLGTPHLGAPLAAGIGSSARTLARWPETGAFGRFLDWRSMGVHDLVEGLDSSVPALPHADYHLVSATVTRSERHPVGRWLGDALVRQPSAYGVRGAEELFPGADVLHVGSAEHLGLLNHPRVHDALRTWLS
jgi:pimeloyl-ACP methyl ester carboxylesterase